MKTLEILFFVLLFIVFYTYIGYGMLLWLMVKLKKFFGKPKKSYELEKLPEVTLFITAYNEEQVVDKKMQNCHELNYPKDKLRIMWVTDGSNDHTNELLAR